MASMEEGMLMESERQKAKPVYGNYVNYYSKRDVSEGIQELDSRLQLIPPAYLRNKVILDLGCNTGRVSIQLASQLEAKRVVGIDIDEALIRRAVVEMKKTWSTHSPLTSIVPTAPTPSSSNYFPNSMSRMYGFLPIPPRSHLTVSSPDVNGNVNVNGKGKGRAIEGDRILFPGNVTFIAQDWVQDTQVSFHDTKYDVILAFSITKWIHLHHLTPGLLAFFQKVYASLKPNGIFIVEPQPFSTYSKSAKFSETLRTNWNTLKAQEWNDVQMEVMLLQTVGFHRKEELGVTGQGGFKRPVDVYHK